MGRSLWFVFKLALLVVAMGWLVERPGRVTLIWQGYRLDTSMPVLLIAVVALVVLGAQLYRLWRALRYAPRSFMLLRLRRRRERGYQALTQGLVAVAAGDAVVARRFAHQADQLLGEPPLTLLLSAQAAQLNGDEEAASRYFRAMQERKETAFLGIRGLLTQALKRGQEEEALRLARLAHDLQPRTPWVLSTLIDLEARARHWQDAAGLLPEAVRRGAVPKATARARQTFLLIEQSAAARRQGEDAAALAAARSAFKLTPGFAPAALAYAELLRGRGKIRAATKVLEQAWKQAPHPDLAAAYKDQEETGDALLRVKRMERLLALVPESGEGRLALAGAALEARLWGTARQELAAVLAESPGPRACRLRATLERAEHGDQIAAAEWETRAAETTPDPAWVCSECGAAHAKWTGLCPACGSFDSLSWKRPQPPGVTREPGTENALLPGKRTV